MIPDLPDINRIITRLDPKLALDLISRYLPVPASKRVAHHVKFHIHDEVEGGIHRVWGEGYG